MKLAAATGMSTVAASQLTVADVKATDSDQVRIPIDTEGKYKKNVPADWYNQLKNAERTKKEIKKEFIHKSAVVSIGHDAGKYGGENPRVKVRIDPNHEEADERRGEVPEYKNGVEILTDDGEIGYPDSCDPETYDSDKYPGGLAGQFRDNSSQGGYCTFTSQLVNGSRWSRRHGWSMAAHCLPDDKCVPSDWDGDMELVHVDTSTGNVVKRLGRAWFVDMYKDFVAVERYSHIDSLSQVADPEFPGEIERHDISGTLTREGLSDLVASDTTFINRGIGSCTTSGQIEMVNEDKYLAEECTESFIEDQVVGYYGGTDGDSGSLVYSEPLEQANYQRFASHSHTGSVPLTSEDFGPAGYAIRDDRNMWWDDL